MPTLSAGKDVLAYCNKCKLKLAHIIVVMNDPTTPGKVTCKTCGSTHSFKESAARRKTTIKKLTKKKKEEISQTNKWEELVSAPTSEAKKYSPKSTFAEGDYIEHPKFGIGHVEKKLDGKKIEVLFRTATKILVHNL